MKNRYLNLPLLCLFSIFFALVLAGQSLAEERVFGRHGANVLVYEDLGNTYHYRMYSPKGKLLWEYSLVDKGANYVPYYAEGKIYQIAYPGDSKLHLYSIEPQGKMYMQEFRNTSIMLTQAGMVYDKKEKGKIYFAPYTDLAAEVAYDIPEANFLYKAYSTGGYLVLEIGDHNLVYRSYILKDGAVLWSKKNPKKATLAGADFAGDYVFLYMHQGDYYYLQAYHSKSKRFFAKQVKPNKGSLSLSHVVSHGEGYRLYGSYTDGAFVMDMDAKLQMQKSRLYEKVNPGLSRIGDESFLWEWSQHRLLPLESYPERAWKMWLS